MVPRRLDRWFRRRLNSGFRCRLRRRCRCRLIYKNRICSCMSVVFGCYCSTAAGVSVTKPFRETVATASLSEDHVTLAPSILLPFGSVTTDSCENAPACILLAPCMAMPSTPLATLTVQYADTAPFKIMACIFVLPRPTAVTLPFESTVTTDLSSLCPCYCFVTGKFVCHMS